MLSNFEKEKIYDILKQGIAPILDTDLSRFVSPDSVITREFDGKTVVCKTKQGESVFVQSYNTAGVCVGFNIYSPEFISRVCGICDVDYIGVVKYRGDEYDILFSARFCSGNILIVRENEDFVVKRKYIKD